MLGIAPAITAAIIVTSVALLSLIVNVASAHIIRWQDKRDRRHDWLKDKQNRDAEEIIQSLSAFAKTFSDKTGVLYAKQWNLNRKLDDLLIDKTYEYSASLVAFSESRFNKLLAENNQAYQTDIDSISEIANSMMIWFNFDAQRLSIWFDEAEEIEITLSQLYSRFLSVQVGLDRSYSKQHHFFSNLERRRKSENNTQISQRDVERSNSNMRQADRAIKDWAEFNDEITSFQKVLVNRFKPSKTKVIYTPTQDGILVKGARWIEQKLRLLLQLG